VEINIGTVEMHTHFHPGCLHFGPFGNGLVDLALDLQLVYLFLVVLEFAGQRSIFSLGHGYLLF
jgi:hypothetical protein